MSSTPLFSHPQSQSVPQPQDQDQGQEQQPHDSSKPGPQKQTLIKLTILCYRNASLSESEFHHHWTHIHAPKVSAHLAKFGIVSYRQFHTPTSLRAQLASKVPSLGIKDTHGDKWADYDGYVELLMPELECFERARNDEYYARVVDEDEKIFADLDASRIAVGWEEVWVEGGKVVER